MRNRIRIEHAPACEVINLTEEEEELYHGCGWAIAGFANGKLKDLRYLGKVVIEEEVTEGVGALSREELAQTTRWKHYMEFGLAQLNEVIANGQEPWLVMCSCYQLCEPRPLALDDAGSIAALSRAIREEISV